jgi:hypothetical protein
VERTFQLYSPLIAGIEVKRRGDVRRAKLYYLRERSGKSARIKEKLVTKAKAARRCRVSFLSAPGNRCHAGLRRTPSGVLLHSWPPAFAHARVRQRPFCHT